MNVKCQEIARPTTPTSRLGSRTSPRGLAWPGTPSSNGTHASCSPKPDGQSAAPLPGDGKRSRRGPGRQDGSENSVTVGVDKGVTDGYSVLVGPAKLPAGIQRTASRSPRVERIPRTTRSEREFKASFWEKVDKGRDDDTCCWLWKGGTYRSGYGRVFVRKSDPNRWRKAHRLAWELETGDRLPSDVWVLHRCDVRNCCRLSHLFLGNAALNNEDCRSKGRARFSHRQMLTLVSDDVVEVIRKRYANGDITKSALAVEYGLSPSTVGRYISGARRSRPLNWKHVA